MFLRKALGAIATVAVVITLPIVLLLSNLYLLATPAFLRMEYSKPTVPLPPGFTAEERLRLAEASLRYLRSNQGIDALQQLEHAGKPLYNVRELVHMADVKRVMYWAFFTHAVAVVILVLATIYLLCRADLRGRLPVLYFWGALLLALPIVVIGGVALFSFDQFFVLFNRLFFTGDSWLFAGTDALIRLFPLQFWIDASMLYVILAFGEAVLVGSAAYLWPGWQHGRRARQEAHERC